MSDMFESLELNMREEAERINPSKAIMASQLECEQRFESFVAKNPERVEFLSDDIRSVADKYAAEYNISSETIYDATVNHLKEAAVKRAEWDKPWTEEDESKEEPEEGESEEHEESESEEEEKEEDDEEEEKKEASVKEAKECECWDGYKRVPGTKPCAPGSCEKCDAHRKKEAAIEEFINLHEAALIPDWMRPQKGMTWKELLQRSNRQNLDGAGVKNENVEDQTSPAAQMAPSDEQPTVELNMPSGGKSTEYEDMIEDQSRAEEAMKENARKREEMIAGEPQFKTRGPKRYEYLRGASVQDELREFYLAQGMPEKTASILVEAVGEMAQLQQDAPGLPLDSSDPENVNIDKEIGGPEGDKYQNWDVKDKQKELDADHQDFTDFGDPVREFIQPGGEAPYSENTKKRIDKAEQDNMSAKKVKQEDNAPKKSSSKESAKEPYSMSGHRNEDESSEKYMNYGDKIKKLMEDGMTEAEAEAYLKDDYGLNNYQKKDSASAKEASDLSLVPPEGVRNAAKRGIKYHSEGKAGDGFEAATLTRAKKIAEGQELTPEHVKRMHSFFERHAGGRSKKAKPGEVTPWDVAWLAWGGDAGRTWAASKVKQMEKSKTSTPIDFDTIDSEVEKLMSQGMTPEQAIQSLDVYNDKSEPVGWGGSNI